MIVNYYKILIQLYLISNQKKINNNNINGLLKYSAYILLILNLIYNVIRRSKCTYVYLKKHYDLLYT